MHEPGAVPLDPPGRAAVRGLRKPDPAIYELTASKIGLPPGDCLFVDDTEANLPAARELGMGALFFTGADGEVAEIERLLGIA